MLIHLKRTALGALVLILIAAFLWVMWILFAVMVPAYPIPLGVIVVILLSYVIGVMIGYP